MSRESSNEIAPVVSPDSQMLVSAKSDLTVSFGNMRISIARGAIAYLQASNSALAVTNLCDKRRASVSLQVGSHKTSLSPGEQVLVGANHEFGNTLASESIGHRRLRRSVYEGMLITRSEVSLVTLLSNTDLFAFLKNADGMAVRNRILKTAACISVVTAAHGAYESARTSSETAVNAI